MQLSISISHLFTAAWGCSATWNSSPLQLKLASHWDCAPWGGLTLGSIRLSFGALTKNTGFFEQWKCEGYTQPLSLCTPSHLVTPQVLIVSCLLYRLYQWSPELDWDIRVFPEDDWTKPWRVKKIISNYLSVPPVILWFIFFFLNEKEMSSLSYCCVFTFKRQQPLWICHYQWTTHLKQP